MQSRISRIWFSIFVVLAFVIPSSAVALDLGASDSVRAKSSKLNSKRLRKRVTIKSLSLVDLDNGKVIRKYKKLQNGQTVELDSIDSPSIGVRVNLRGKKLVSEIQFKGKAAGKKINSTLDKDEFLPIGTAGSYRLKITPLLTLRDKTLKGNSSSTRFKLKGKDKNSDKGKGKGPRPF